MEAALVFVLMTMAIGAPFILLAWLSDLLVEGER